MHERRVVYISQSLIGGDLGEIERIRRISRRNNRFNEISGALYLDTNLFFQVLEGYPAQIEDLLKRLSVDRRHRNLLVLQDTVLEAREFVGWDMKVVNGISVPELEPNFEYETLRGGGSGLISERILDLQLA